MLYSNLASGLICLVAGVIGLRLAPAFYLIGLCYVVAASLFLAFAYGSEPLTRRRELVTWAVPWVAAGVLWTALIGPVSADFRLSLGSVVVGFTIATGCYLLWQAVALAFRHGFKP